MDHAQSFSTLDTTSGTIASCGLVAGRREGNSSPSEKQEQLLENEQSPSYR